MTRKSKSMSASDKSQKVSMPARASRNPASKAQGANSSPASTRSLGQRSATKRSRYVEHDSADEEAPSSDVESADEVSGYEGGGASSPESTADERDASDDDASESDAPPRKRHKKGPAPRSVSKGTELWRQNVKTGLGPGVEVVIKKPRPRSPGPVPYKDDEIHPNTMLFLADLARNNDREWLKMHDPDYRTSWKDFTAFLEPLSTRLIEIDGTVPELPTKDIIFRIYRDIRFSPDPTPYKDHFSVAWSRTGRKGPYAAYYLQIKPGGGSFVGGGLWMPEAAALRALRRDIDRKPHKIREVLLNPQVRKQLLRGAPAHDKKAIRAFTAQNADNALKKRPKDYAADHADIELMRLKNYTMGCKLKDEEVTGPKAIDRICEVIQALLPFVTYLNSVVMPDNPDESEDEDEEADEDGEGGESGEDGVDGE